MRAAVLAISLLIMSPTAVSPAVSDMLAAFCRRVCFSSYGPGEAFISMEMPVPKPFTNNAGLLE